MRELPNVLLCEARSVTTGVRLPEFDPQIWKRIERKQDIRYQLLPEVDPAVDSYGVGAPALLIDFKRYFTLPTDELYRRSRLRLRSADRVRRHAVLRSPFLEDVAHRFFNFQSRVALPDDKLAPRA